MAKKLIRRWLQFRLGALFWLVLVASLASLWYVHRQRRIEHNAQLDQSAAQAKRLLDYSAFYEFPQGGNRTECARDEVATRWLIEIARRKRMPAEAEQALQELSIRIKRLAKNVRILEQNGSRGGEEHEVFFAMSRQAQGEVAFAQLHGSGGEVRDAMAGYVLPC